MTTLEQKFSTGELDGRDRTFGTCKRRKQYEVEYGQEYCRRYPTFGRILANPSGRSYAAPKQLDISVMN